MKILSLVSGGLLALMMFSSCSKEKSIDTTGGGDSTLNPGGPAVHNDLVRTYTEEITSPVLGNSKTTYDLSYDQNNRITALTPTTPGLKIEYSYPNTTTVNANYYDSGSLLIQVTFWLNARGLADSSIAIIDGDTSTEKFIYNSSFELTEDITYDYSTVTGSEIADIDHYTFDSKGNPLSQVDENGTITYTYTTHVNPVSLGEVFFYQSPNLPATATADDGSDTATATFEYAYDSSNRLSKITKTTTDGTVTIQTFTY